MTAPALPSDTVVAPSPAPEDPADGAARGPRPRSRGRWVAQFFTGAVLSYLWAAVCNASLNVLQTGGDVSRIFTYDLRIFDPTWRYLTSRELRDKVALRIPHISSAKARKSAKAYLEFLDMGGTIGFEELTPSLLKRILDRDHAR